MVYDINGDRIVARLVAVKCEIQFFQVGFLLLLGFWQACIFIMKKLGQKDRRNNNRENYVISPLIYQISAGIFYDMHLRFSCPFLRLLFSYDNAYIVRPRLLPPSHFFPALGARQMIYLNLAKCFRSGWFQTSPTFRRLSTRWTRNDVNYRKSLLVSSPSHRNVAFDSGGEFIYIFFRTTTFLVIQSLSSATIKPSESMNCFIFVLEANECSKKLRLRCIKVIKICEVARNREPLTS